MERRAYTPVPDASSTTVTIGAQSMSVLRDAFSDGTPLNGLLTALLTGSLLLYINHYNDRAADIPKIQILLTYLVPYMTYTIGAISAKRKSRIMLIELQSNYGKVDGVYSTPSDQMIRQKRISTADFIISPTPFKPV